MRTFEFNGAKVTVSSPNGFSKIRQWNYNAQLRSLGDLPPDVSELGGVILFYLVNTVSVDGDLGFPVPLSNPTADDLLSFIMGVGCADGELTQLWDDSILLARVATNDPDLLPPGELEKKSTTEKKSS